MEYLELKTMGVLSLYDVRKKLPNVSIPANADLTMFGYEFIEQLPQPEVLQNHRLEIDAPKHNGEKWVRGWIQVPLTDEEILEIQKSTIPQQVTMRQARLALLYSGLLEQVESALEQIPDPVQRMAINIEWKHSSVVDRDHPMLEWIGHIVGLDTHKMWDMMKYASTL